MLQLSFALRSDAGRVRGNNEDNFYWNGQYRQDVNCLHSTLGGSAVPDRQILAAVCDGMGGEACGELASLMAVRHLRPCAFEAVKATAEQSIREANDEICEEMKQRRRRMGTTLAALYLDGGRAMACNIGDSRVYLFRSGSLRQLTRDHSKASRLVRMGILTEEEARNHPSKHELTQHLGILPEEMVLEPEFSEELEVHPGDLFLLCSDGLTDMAGDAEIAKLLSAHTDVARKADALLAAALEHGGRDNITLVLLSAERPPLLQRMRDRKCKQEATT